MRVQARIAKKILEARDRLRASPLEPPEEVGASLRDAMIMILEHCADIALQTPDEDPEDK